MKPEFQNKSHYTLRPLDPEKDWEIFREHLIRAYGENYMGFLKSEPDTADGWKAQMGEYTQFALFIHGEMIGSTAMYMQDATAILTDSIIEEEHRGKGLADYFYEARLSYLRQINYEGRAIVGILDTNDRSLDAARRNSFEVIGERLQPGPGYHERYIVLSRQI